MEDITWGCCLNIHLGTMTLPRGKEASKSPAYVFAEKKMFMWFQWTTRHLPCNPLSASSSQWLRQDQFKSFIGHLNNARNDTIQTMKILQTFWALAQNEGARLGSAEQRLNSCAGVRGNAWTDRRSR